MLICPKELLQIFGKISVCPCGVDKKLYEALLTYNLIQMFRIWPAIKLTIIQFTDSYLFIIFTFMDSNHAKFVT
jgi:hypothetical protein